MKHLFQEFDHVYTIGENACKIVNVFFPIDCKNNCPFCTTKKWYEDANEKRWKKNFEVVLKSQPNIIVITGGEPMADLDFLHSMLMDILFETPKTTVYLNTSYIGNNATKSAFVSLMNRFYSNNVIGGVNISRHMPMDIEFFDLFEFPIRINAVIKNDGQVAQAIELINFFKDFKNATLVLREDYARINRNNLYDFSSDVLKLLTENYTLKEHQYCHFCSNFTFEMKCNPLKIRYHRGTNTTSAQIGTLKEHMELVLAPNGIIYSDWDGSTDGVDELLTT